MSSHTPGPWKHLQHFTDNKRNGVLVIGPDEWHVAACWATNPDGRGIEETDANARLIAAAPELLSALRALVAFYVDDSRGAQVETSEIPYAGYQSRDIKAAWLDAWRVLARAEGVS